MSNSYSVLKQKQQEEVNKFPMAFAFNREQFRQAMEKLGFSTETKDYEGNVVSIGLGGYIRKDDTEALHALFDKHENELAEAIENDPTGDGFIYDMFSYELANHEYCVTYDTEPTLRALGLSFEDIIKNGRLEHGLKKACREQEKN